MSNYDKPGGWQVEKAVATHFPPLTIIYFSKY